jgi:hypothetical protein
MEGANSGVGGLITLEKRRLDSFPTRSPLHSCSWTFFTVSLFPGWVERSNKLFGWEKENGGS